MSGTESVSAIVEAEKEAAKFIFGLAIAIGTLSLITRLPARPLGIVTDVAEFGFSFLILISVWLGYWNIMAVLPLEDNTVVILNVALMFLVSIEPYLFYLNITFDLLTHEVFLYFASTLYALDMTGLVLILALFTHQLAQEEKKLVPAESIASYRWTRNILFASAALFAITILPIFWSVKIDGQPLRFFFWFIPLVLSSVRHVTDQKSKRGD